MVGIASDRRDVERYFEGEEDSSLVLPFFSDNQYRKKRTKPWMMKLEILSQMLMFGHFGMRCGR